MRDHDRPLTRRGRRAAKAIARHLREREIVPQLVLCSTARRARETLERIEPALGTGVVRVAPELYGASANDLLEQLRAVPAAVDSVLLIGHNPGLQRLALELARPASAAAELAARFPTAAIAMLDFHGASWRDLGHGNAELVGFVRPRDLEH